MQDGGVVAFALPTSLVDAARLDPFSERRDRVARLPDIVRRVLKVGRRHDEAAHEADALRAWG